MACHYDQCRLENCTDEQVISSIMGDNFLSPKKAKKGMATIGRPRLYPDERTRQREKKRRYRKAKQTQHKVYHRSLTGEWGTPQAFFDRLDAEFGFTLDVAAQAGNAKCARYFTPEVNGLAQPWEGVCWCNPPYGKTIGLWVAKAHDSALLGACVVCLLPVRTDTQWWQRFVLAGAEVRFVPGRLTFGGAANPAPFPNAVVIFRPAVALARRCS
jgi:phage N-6-adenine-methyltransferase